VSDLRPAAVVVLAAGEGTRMRSATPKVLHEIAGRSLLGHVLAAVRPVAAARTLVVVGVGRDRVAASLAGTDADPVVQEQQNGTGHAVRVALAEVPDVDPEEVVVVVPGDAPLLRPTTVSDLLQAHADSGAAATLLTARVPDPAGYGRVLRRPDGQVRAVVEERDADPPTRAISEIATSVYAFGLGPLRGALTRLSTANAQGEEYLTEVVELLVADGLPVGAHVCADPGEVAGVNDRVQLAAAGRELRDRLVRGHQLAGVTVIDPATTWIDVEVTVEPDVTLLPGTRLRGRTSLARGAVVGPDCTLTDTTVAAGAVVRSSTCESAEVGEGAAVGPYTFLRPGTRLGAGAKAGAYVEIKNARLGADSKVPHLSYVGDAEIGERSNVGAATVFVNYDGVAKHHTTVGSDVRIGSDTMLVAPVTVGDGAYTAAGSVITQDVPPGALGLGRARQRNVEGWVSRRRGTPGTAPDPEVEP
jgi:bifunctional UDP-N-acetylglucosamine pyrophosphorylase/glucosamine-1-phosphate N-acetyltransferase